MNNKKQPFPKPLMASKHPQKPPLHSPAFQTLMNVATHLPAKHNYAGKETAAPMGAQFITESTQRPFCVFCGNWIVGLSESHHGKSAPDQFTTEDTEDTESKAFLRALRALRGELITDVTRRLIQKALLCPSATNQTRTPRLSEANAKAVPGSAGISARETPCARLMYLENASRAKRPALPGAAA
jgi:hypothetical protein